MTSFWGAYMDAKKGRPRGPELVPLTVRLPAELAEKLRAAAEVEQRSLNAQIIWVLSRGVKK